MSHTYQHSDVPEGHKVAGTLFLGRANLSRRRLLMAANDDSITRIAFIIGEMAEWSKALC